MSYMLKKAVNSNGTEITIDFNRALVSMGTLMPVFNGTATLCKGQMLFNWYNNSGIGNAENADMAMLLVYNKDKEIAIYNTEAALRSDGYAELPLPNDWYDDELITYLSFRSVDGNSVANSIRLSVSIMEEITGDTEKREVIALVPSEKLFSFQHLNIASPIVAHILSVFYDEDRLCESRPPT